MLYNKAIWFINKDLYWTVLLPFFDLEITRHFVHAARNTGTVFSFWWRTVILTVSRGWLKLGTSQLQNTVTVHPEGSAHYRVPLSAHSKIHSTPDNSVFALFITSCARVTTWMRLLVHFTTTTYAWYECRVPQASSFAVNLTFLSTPCPRIPLSFLYLLCLLLFSLLHFYDLQRKERTYTRRKNYKAESKIKTGYVGECENKKKLIKQERHVEVVCRIQRYIQ